MNSAFIPMRRCHEWGEHVVDHGSFTGEMMPGGWARPGVCVPAGKQIC